jgi:hypothetical protein
MWFVSLLPLVLLVACKTANPLSCELDENRDLPECGGVDTDCQPACGTGQICVMGACACTANEGCIGDPAGSICDDGTCVPCTAHEQCFDSQLCLLTEPGLGTCAAPEDVLYVAEDGTDPTCQRDAPCGDLEAARDLIDDDDLRRIIKITGAIINPKEAVFDTAEGTVRIFGAPGASLSRSGTGTIFDVKGSANLTIHGLEIARASVHGVQVTNLASAHLERVVIHGAGGLGVSATGTGKLTLRRSVIANNDGGGVDIDGLEVEMTNTIVVANGVTASSDVGGVELKAKTATTPLFEFNTIANNVSGNAATAGVNCVNDFPARGNIVTGNRVSLSCTQFERSLFDAGSVPPMGTNNAAGVPRFVSTSLADVTRSTFYRIAPNSDARDAALGVGTTTIDIDGEPRPTDLRDMGADEVQ